MDNNQNSLGRRRLTASLMILDEAAGRRYPPYSEISRLFCDDQEIVESTQGMLSHPLAQNPQHLEDEMAEMSSRPVRASFTLDSRVTTSAPWPNSPDLIEDFSARLRLRLTGITYISPLASHLLNVESEDILEGLIDWIEELKATCLKGHVHIRHRIEPCAVAFHSAHYFGFSGVDVKEPVGELRELWWEQIEALEL